MIFFLRKAKQETQKPYWSMHNFIEAKKLQIVFDTLQTSLFFCFDNVILLGTTLHVSIFRLSLWPSKKRGKCDQFASVTTGTYILSYISLFWEIISQEHFNIFQSVILQLVIDYIHSESVFDFPQHLMFFEFVCLEKRLSMKWILAGLQQLLNSWLLINES